MPGPTRHFSRPHAKLKFPFFLRRHRLNAVTPKPLRSARRSRPLQAARWAWSSTSQAASSLNRATHRSFDELALGVGIRGLLLGRAAQLGGGLLVQRQGVVDDGDAGVVVGGKAHGARGEREHHVLELHVELAAPPRAAPNGVDGQVQALQDGHQLAARQHLGLEADGVAQR